MLVGATRPRKSAGVAQPASLELTDHACEPSVRICLHASWACGGVLRHTRNRVEHSHA